MRSKLNILYIGDSSHDSLPKHRANALTRIGNNVIIEDPIIYLNQFFIYKNFQNIHFKTGYIFLKKIVLNYIYIINLKYSNKLFDIIWIDSGEFFDASAILELKKSSNNILLYNCDDITGNRDGFRFFSLLSALNHYSLIASVRDITSKEISQLSNAICVRIQRSYDEIQHSPLLNFSPVNSIEEYCDVVFIGTWIRDENREEVLNHLAINGINLGIWGGRWHRSKYWNNLKKYWKGPEIKGNDYTRIISNTPISLGFVSKRNRDEASYRSFEVPFSGGLLCAEMTNEHLQIFKDFAKRYFWTTKEECLSVCKNLLSNRQELVELRREQRNYILNKGFGNEDICIKIIGKLNI